MLCTFRFFFRLFRVAGCHGFFFFHYQIVFKISYRIFKIYINPAKTSNIKQGYFKNRIIAWKNTFKFRKNFDIHIK